MGSLPASRGLHVVLCAIPAHGHMRAIRSIARALRALDYPVTFITGSVFKQAVEAIDGVEFVPLQGKADYNFDLIDQFPGRQRTEPGPQRIFYDLEHIFFRPLPDQATTVQAVLRRPDLVNKKVVVITDAGFMGNLPMLLGSPSARRVPCIGIGSFPLMMLSKDTAPFGLGLPSQGEEVNMAMNLKTTEMFSGVQAIVEEVIEPYQCSQPTPSKFPTDNFFLTPDIYAQCTVPSMEPPRRDLPSTVRFIGNLPGGNDIKPLPSWFQEFVLDDATGRPLILVTQGTVPGSTPDELILPTIAACKDLHVRVIVCGVHIGIPVGQELPSNVRWAEWIAFEQVFPYTSIVVTNGGYGGINQAFAAGVPMVVAGITEDKTETCLRAEMSGAAINLRTQVATSEQVKDAVIKILGDASYKSKAVGLQKEFATCDAVASIVSLIDEAVERFYPGTRS